MDDTFRDALENVAGWLRETRQAVAFTGAGISTESGIPDFRSPGGVWSRHRPVMYQDFLNDPAERRRYWAIRKESIPQFLAAQPNVGHRALARLEALGHLLGVITQNIDGLHQRAGSKRVHEVHGTAMQVYCLRCGRRYSCEQIQGRLEAGEDEPTCNDCGGMLKSRTVSFGQSMPEDVWMAAERLAREARLFLSLGSSLVVQPAASLPEMALEHGARLVIINHDPTPLDDSADCVIRNGIGETMQAIMVQLNQPV